MPIREFHCKQCHAEFEELVFGDAVPACTHCGASRVEQLMSCCRIKATGTDSFSAGSSASGAASGGCSGCSGGSCGSCH